MTEPNPQEPTYSMSQLDQPTQSAPQAQPAAASTPAAAPEDGSPTFSMSDLDKQSPDDMKHGAMVNNTKLYEDPFDRWERKISETVGKYTPDAVMTGANWLNEKMLKPDERTVELSKGLGEEKVGKFMGQMDADIKHEMGQDVKIPSYAKGLESNYLRKQEEEQDPIETGVVEGLAGLGATIISDPKNWPFLAKGLVKSASTVPAVLLRPYMEKAMSKFFGVQMARGASSQLENLVANWPNLSKHEQAKGVTELLGGIYMAQGALREGFKGAPKVETGTVPPEKGGEGPLPKPAANRVRPNETEIAGNKITTSPLQTEDAPGVTARTLAGQASPAAARDFQEGQRPALTDAAIDTLGQQFQDRVAAHEALVNGEPAPDAITGTQVRSDYENVDKMHQAMQQSSERTYAKADVEDAKDLATWQRDVKAAQQNYREAVEYHNELVRDHNANPDNAENQLAYESYDESQAQVPPRPKTYAELKAEVDRIKRDENSTDNAVRAQAFLDFDKADKALDKWFDNHEEAIPAAEYRSAKRLRADAEAVKKIADAVRQPIIDEKLTSSNMSAAERMVNAKSVRRGYSENKFAELLGPEAYSNWKQVKKLFEPVKAGGKTWGTLALQLLAHHAIAWGLNIPSSVVFGGDVAGVVGEKAIMRWFSDKMLFDPKAFAVLKSVGDFMKSSKDAVIHLPQTIRDQFTNLVNSYKKSSEKGMAGADINRPQFGRKGLGGAAAPAPALEPTPKDEGDDFVHGAIADWHNQHQGFSYNPKEGFVHDQPVFSVGGEFHGPDYESVVPGGKIKPEHVSEFMNRPAVKEALAADSRNNVGGWNYKGDAHLEVSKMFHDRAEAEAEGKRLNQDSIYDHANRETIPLGGTAAEETRTQAQAKPKTITAYHWSPEKGLTELDPAKFGSHKHTVEARRLRAFPDQSFPVTFLGTDKYNEPLIQHRGNQYVADLNPADYYDLSKDPDGLVEQATRNAAKKGHFGSDAVSSYLDRLVKSKGFSGHIDADGVVRSFEPVKVRPYDKEAADLKQMSSKPDDDWMGKARESLGPDATLSQVAMEAGRLKTEAGATAKRPEELSQTMNASAAVAPAPYQPTPEESNVVNEGRPSDEQLAELNQKALSTRVPTNVDSDPTNQPSHPRGMAGIDEADKVKPSRKTANGDIKQGYAADLADELMENPATGVKVSAKERANPRQVIEKYVNHFKDNLVDLYKAVPNVVKGASKQWYESAHYLSKRIADQYDVTHEQVAAVIAALSPQNFWDNNAGIAERFVKHWSDAKQHKFDPLMDEQVDRIRGEQTKKNAKLLAKGKDGSQVFIQILDALRGKDYNDLEKIPGIDTWALRRLQGTWLRVFDEAHGNKDVPLYSPDGSIRGATERTHVTYDMIAKAIDLLENPDVQSIHRIMGQGQKTRNFYNNIINPWSTEGHVTIDTHAVGAAHGKPVSGEDKAVKQNFKMSPKVGATGITGTYPVYEEAYTRAAKELGVQPRELQSVTWEGIRSLIADADKKSPQFRKDIDAIWQQVEKGKMTRAAAYKAVIERAGGFKKPDWVNQQDWDREMGPQPEERPNGPLPTKYKDASTEFNPSEFNQDKTVTLGQHPESMSADVNPPSDPAVQKWKGQPQPTITKVNGRVPFQALKDTADWVLANAKPEEILSTAAHEMAHALLQHHLGFGTDGMTISLGARAVKRGQKLPEGGSASKTGIVDGFVSPGTGPSAKFDATHGNQAARQEFIEDFVTQLMAGRAVEQILQVPGHSIGKHVSGDVAMARSAMKAVDIPSFLHETYMHTATKRAAAILREQWDTMHHMARQAANHYGGEHIDEATFHKYRQGGTYEKK